MAAVPELVHLAEARALVGLRGLAATVDDVRDPEARRVAQGDQPVRRPFRYCSRRVRAGRAHSRRDARYGAGCSDRMRAAGTVRRCDPVNAEGNRASMPAACPNCSAGGNTGHVSVCCATPSSFRKSRSALQCFLSVHALVVNQSAWRSRGPGAGGSREIRFTVGRLSGAGRREVAGDPTGRARASRAVGGSLPAAPGGAGRPMVGEMRSAAGDPVRGCVRACAPTPMPCGDRTFLGVAGRGVTVRTCADARASAVGAPCATVAAPACKAVRSPVSRTARLLG